MFPPDSGQPTVVHLEPYYPAGVTIAPDGTIWTKGADYNPTPGANGLRQYNKKSSNGILRHFSPSGTFLGSAIPQSGFTITQAVWGDAIASSVGRVGWVQYHGFGAGPKPQGGSYFEVSADGAISKTPLPPFSEGEMIQTLALTDNGYVFIEKTVNGSHPSVYALDRKQGTWSLVQFPATGFQGTTYDLLVATGNTVAFWTSAGANPTAQLVTVQ